MLAVAEAIPGIGHNAPPPTPFEAIEAKINDLYEEAKEWLDGVPVMTQGQADSLNLLMDMIRKAEKEADELRKEEARPHDEAKAEIQARYNVLIGNTKSVKGKTVLALDAAKKALTPWLEEQDRIKREAERKAREEAEAAQRAAQEAFRKAQADDLAAREAAEALAKQAKDAEIAARVAAKDTAKAKGGTGRATTLRSFYRAEVTDAREFARHLWAYYRADMDEFLATMAKRLVDMNHDRAIPGVTIHEERRAV
jgi:hypothetical protein